jgi:ribosomal protein S21
MAQMTSEAPRRERREGFESILRRFFRDVQQSGILSEVKKRRYFSKDISRTAKRGIAIRKAARKRVKRGY